MSSQCANCARNYDIAVRDQRGNFKFPIHDAYSVKWVRRLNKPGVLTMELPLDDCTDACEDGYKITDFDEDYRIEVWRQLTSATGGLMGKSLVGEAPFMVTRIEASRNEEGRRVLYVEAETPLGLLARRINPYSAERNASDLAPRPCDDQMKYVVANNYGPAAESYISAPDTIRNAIAPWLAIEANESAITAQYEGDAENAVVLSTLQKIAEYAQSKGENLFFDIVQISSTGQPAFEFRTYAGQRGIDRRSTVTLVEDVNIGEYKLTYNWQDTVNRAYAGSRGGTDAARLYAVSDDPNLAARLAVNPFALRESFVSSTSDDIADIQTEADVERQSKSNVFSASGVIIESGSLTYGCDFDFGDRVMVKVACQFVEVHLDGEEVELSEGAERLAISFSTDYSLYRKLGGIGQIFSELSRLRRELEQLRRIERA